MATWREDVFKAMGGLGGAAHLNTIYRKVRRLRREPLPKYWKAIIRKELESNSSDSKYFQGKYDIFTSVEGIGGGIWALRKSDTLTQQFDPQSKQGKTLGRVASSGHTPHEWEVRLIKTMIKQGYNGDTILAYFSWPWRSLNPARIANIKSKEKDKNIKQASNEELQDFLISWPEIDWISGKIIEVKPYERLIEKSREAMLLAVQSYNNPIVVFKSEIFIVSAIIAWTYLMHAYYTRTGVDYRFREKGKIKLTPEGAEKYWDLATCLRSNECPLGKGINDNLTHLLVIRHEIEHRMTSRIDDLISALLFACCVNFNDSIKLLFNPKYGLDEQMGLALQFAKFSADQFDELKKDRDLPKNVEASLRNFRSRLSEKELNDPRYALRFVFVPRTANRKSAADRTIEFIRTDPIDVGKNSQVVLKLIEKTKYRAREIMEIMHKEGFTGFRQHEFTQLWKTLGAKKEPYAKELSKGRMRGGDWWYEPWLERVRAHCRKNKEVYSQGSAPVGKPNYR